MLDGVYRNPTEIVFGRTALDGFGLRVARLGRAAMIVHGGAYLRLPGLASRIRGEMDGAGLRWLELGGVRPNPTADRVYEGISVCREKGVEVLVAVGGGSVIDTAKAIGIGCCHEGDFFDLFERRVSPARMLPVAVVLTVFGAGSESSDGVVIEKDGRKCSCSGPAVYPTISVLDPTLTRSVPRELLACGVFDAICHVMERYFSPTTAVETSDELCLSLLRVLSRLGPRLVEEPDDDDLRANVMWAAKLAHDGTVGFGRKADWATHTIAHEVGVRCGRPHGAVLAVLYPAWVQHVHRFHRELVARFARALPGHEGLSSEEAAASAALGLRALARRMGLPSTLAELGFTSRESFGAIADACSLTTLSGTIGNLRRLKKAEVVQILEIASGG